MSTRKIQVVLLLCLLQLVNIRADTLNCLTSAGPVDFNSLCKDYNLCNTCKNGQIVCQNSKPALTCTSCNQFQFLLNGITYCSSTAGCAQLDKAMGYCQKCTYNYYANFKQNSPTDLEIQCSQSPINLLTVMSSLNSLTGYSPNLVFQTKLEIIYKYAILVLGNSQLVEQVRSIWFFSKDVEECGGANSSTQIYQNCQCTNNLYGSRCQLQQTAATQANNEIQKNIIPALNDLQSAFSKLQTNQLQLQYAYQIIFILRVLAEVADGFDVTTYQMFYTLQSSFISAILAQNTVYGLSYWLDLNPLTNSKDPSITNFSVLFSFYSTFADRLSQTIDQTLLSQLSSTSSNLVTPDTIIMDQIKNYYQQIIQNGFATNQLVILKATKLELYFQLNNVNSNAQTQQTYSNLDQVSDFSFMSLESLSSIKCNANEQLYPRFFISKKAFSQIVSSTQPSQSQTFQTLFFINQFSSNVYQYEDSSVNSPIVQARFLYGVSQAKKFDDFQFALQQDYVAVLIPKFKTHQYLSGATSSVTCMVLDENSNKWTSSTELGVDNSQTINCDTHVICYYNLLQNFGKNIKLGYKITISTNELNDEFFERVHGDWWRTSGFIITFILLGLLILFMVLFLFVPSLNSLEAPKRKIQIQEQELQNKRLNKYNDNNNNNNHLQTEGLDTEQRFQTEQNAGRQDIYAIQQQQYQQEDQYSNANIIETTEMDANMTFSFYSIVHTQERKYKIQKITILIMSWHFMACFLGVMYRKLYWSNSNIVVGIVYTIIASWFAGYIWGFIAVKFRRTVEGSPSVSTLYYIIYICLFIFLFFIELQATEYYYDYPNRQKWHGVGFLLCVLFDYFLFDIILLFIYQYLSTHQQAFFHKLGSILRHRGYYQH
ncbi:transmembrane protein, putative (macronuclear) [Tetrahymena thermophila SB210]|uniref:Transmembrane protein, putative n=1 Tax=Tetrahymena thermophila (strain SB210) TaxID=312017 RepID=Q23J79_TETTS|nr:transmembrane protein, putative [Tetrahymena thermophila SB210]EAR96625.2 transmembrane protein, putative [Tetrahymena thermophila SB210]|eukprot:XP_001016870.2 transmembrane protein, putative [Tetrahymena thermophila SB210]